MRRYLKKMNDLELFQLSLTKKSPQFLKSGGYHFVLPERVKNDWAELNKNRTEKVVEAMQSFSST